MKRQSKILILSSLALATSTLTFLATSATTDVATTTAFEPEATSLSGTAPDSIPHTQPGVIERDEVPPTAPAGYYGAAPGSRFCYALDVESTYGMHQTGSQEEPQQARLGLRACLLVDVLDRRNGQILTACRMQSACLRLPDRQVTSRSANAPEPLRRLIAAVEGEVLVRRDSAGAILAYRFAEGVGGDERNFVRAALAAFSFPVPADAPGHWGGAQDDASGRYRARYRRTEPDRSGLVRVTRTKLAYSILAAACGKKPQHEVAGSANAVLSTRLGWLREGRVDETLAIQLPGLEATFRLRYRGNVRLTAATKTLPRRASELWRGDWVAASGHDEEVGANAEAEERKQLQREFANVDVASLVRELREQVETGKADSRATFESWTRLYKLLEIRPESAADVVNLLMTQSASGDLAGLLVTALGAAGSKQGQDALLALRSNGRLTEELREAATVAMVQLAKPRKTILEQLLGDLRRTRSFEAADGTAMLTLGTLANRNASVLENGKTALESLIGLESRAQQAGAVSTWLAALGNSAAPDALPHVLRYVKDADRQTREAALNALRGLRVGKVGEQRLRSALQAVAEQDADASLRSMAQRILLRRATGVGKG